MNDGAFIDFALTNNCIRPNIDFIINLGLRINDGCFMNGIRVG